MNKKGASRILGILISLILLIAVLHTVFHFVAYGTGFEGFYKTGISGFSIGKFTLDEEFKTRYSTYSPASKIALGAEWGILVLLIILSIFRESLSFKKESAIDISKAYETDNKRIKTDIDVVYSLLKEKKSLPISTISRVFKVDKETALEWCNILESGNLAELYYPKFGEPEIRLGEYEK